MKGIKSAYWISTGLFSFIMLVVASGYLASGQLKTAFSNLGVAKFAGVIGLLLPMVKGRVKEWLYAGFAITLCSGLVTHYTISHAAGSLMLPLIMLAILIVSYITYRRLNLWIKIRGIVYGGSHAAWHQAKRNPTFAK